MFQVAPIMIWAH